MTNGFAVGKRGVSIDSASRAAVALGFDPRQPSGRAMAEVPGVGAIVEQIKARIALIEEQLGQHRDLSNELERLRDALGRLERGVGARVRGRRARGNDAELRPTAGTATTKRAATARRQRRGAAAAPRGQTRAK